MSDHVCVILSGARGGARGGAGGALSFGESQYSRASFSLAMYI